MKGREKWDGPLRIAGLAVPQGIQPFAWKPCWRPPEKRRPHVPSTQGELLRMLAMGHTHKRPCPQDRLDDESCKSWCDHRVISWVRV